MWIYPLFFSFIELEGFVVNQEYYFQSEWLLEITSRVLLIQSDQIRKYSLKLTESVGKRKI